MIKRPSYSEIQRKIRQAREAILKNNFSILKPTVIAIDALELGIHFEEINPVLIDLLDEIGPGNYEGQYPPRGPMKVKFSGPSFLHFVGE